MGRDFEDTEVQSIITNQTMGYAIVTDASEPGSIRIPLGGKMQSPEMISGMILSKLIRDGETELQGKITQAVVTVPAYFSDRQKFATRAACDYAGIKLLRLLPEPTAAALSFGMEELDKNDARTLMVFDLGGGTFDISVLSVAGGSFMEITKGGDMWLGGDNIDALLVDHIFACAQKEAGCSPIADLIDLLPPADKARFLVEIKEKAAMAKIALSTQNIVNIDLFGVLKDENQQLIDIDVSVDRETFDKLLAPIVKRITDITHQILHEIRFEPELIDTILLVGGSSLIPAIQDEIKRLFGAEKVLVHPRPLHAIAEGAALMAAKMTHQETSEPLFSMMHSSAHDYYLQLAGGKRHLLVARNTPLPISVEEKLTFSHHEQSLARLRVFNEVDGVLDTVGELWFHKEDTDLMDEKNTKPTELMLRFSVDEDNIITMKAWSLHNEELSVEAQIARGGLAAKLYNDLEHVLSSIIAHSESRSMEFDALRLSRTIVSTIHQASDPITGETCVEQKNKAQQQINTLKHCQEKDLSPLSRYQFALIAQEKAKSVLSAEEQSRLSVIIDAYQQALADLDNVDSIEQLDDELEDFYDDFHIVAKLAQAEDTASSLERHFPREAKLIRNQAIKLAQLHGQPDQDLIEDAEYQLNKLMHSEFSWSDRPTGRFDRDVQL
ncbi:MAG TPA: hypothetical protein DDY37_05290 [Legionella sp.]|nr:hypothetical protein [Legionella sp.]